jgi:fructokinase
MSRKIIGIGETVLDIVFRQNQPQAAVPGGSVFNSMISLGRTVGVQFPEVRLLMESQVGDDYVADLVTDFMRANNVGIEGIQRSGGQSTLSLALLDERNNARYEFFRDKDIPRFRIPDTPVGPSDIAIFGSFFAVSEATGPQTKAFIRKAKEAGATIYYDINFRKNHPVSAVTVEENIALASIVRGSSEDIESLYGTSDAAKVYEEKIAPLCANFICTRGAEDAEVFSPGIRASFPVAPAGSIVSTIGAGDNFNAGIIYSIVRNGFVNEDLQCLSAERWASMVETAMRFSADVCASLYNYVDPGFVNTLDSGYQS